MKNNEEVYEQIKGLVDVLIKNSESDEDLKRLKDYVKILTAELNKLMNKPAYP